MRAIFRIFNECFDSDEWFVVATVPDDFARNIQLNDMISADVLMSFPEFNCEDFILSLTEKHKVEFKKDVQEYLLHYNQTEERAKISAFSDWMYVWDLTVTGRKWCKQKQQEEFYLEFWLNANKG